MKTLNPMMDFVFKALFGREDSTSKVLLIALINDILLDAEEEPIISLEYINPFNYKDFIDDKLSILDIKAKTENGELINIEVQVRNEDNYRKRTLYYWSKAYAESIKEAEDYSVLKKTIAINITGYNAIPESERYHTSFKILEKTDHFPLVEDLQIHFLEVSKLPSKEIEELQGVELWMDFFKKAGREGNEERMKALMERSETMRTAIETLEIISADERMRELANSREKYRLDQASKLKYAERQGMEKGIKKGIKEGIKEEKVNSIIRILTKRFGIISSELNERLRSLDPESLDSIFDKVLDVEVLTEIEELIK